MNLRGKRDSRGSREVPGALLIKLRVAFRPVSYSTQHNFTPLGGCAGWAPPEAQKYVLHVNLRGKRDSRGSRGVPGTRLIKLRVAFGPVFYGTKRDLAPLGGWAGWAPPEA